MRFTNRKSLLLWNMKFFTILTAILLLIASRYLFNFSFPKEPIAIFYVLVAYIGQISLFGFLPLLLIIFPLTIIIPKKRVVYVMSIILASIIISLLLLDTLLFAQNRFHMSLLSISILGIKTWGFGLVYFFISIIFTSKIITVCEKPFIKPLKSLAFFIIPIVLLSLISSHIIHAVADARYFSPITRFSTQLPLFYPSTARRFMVRHGFANIDAARKNRDLNNLNVNSGSTINYPINQLSFDTTKKKMNVLLIIFDGMRSDMLSPIYTPNLYKFSKSCTIFKNHYSGGNSTRMGVFSLFYGIPSTYWKDFAGIQIPCVMIEEFRKSGYELGLFGSHTFDNPASLDRTAFSNIKELRMETKAGEQPFEKDSIISHDWIEWISKLDSTKNFFGFLFYDNPVSKSSPSNQNYKINPKSSSKNDKNFANYASSMKYSDSQVGKVLDNLYKKNLLENTIVIITADHGEEFDDNGLGFNGHGTAYSEYQIHVPLIVKYPDRDYTQIFKRSSHPDIVATIMQDALHCTNPTEDYCSGKNLFSSNEWNWLIIGSYYNHAIVESNQVTVSYPGGYFEVRDSSYNVISNKNLNREPLQKALIEMSRFYKK